MNGAHSPSALDSSRERELLIALNAAEQIPRDKALVLARSPATWATGRHSEDHQTAHTLGVDTKSLRAAKSLLGPAAGIAARETRNAEASGARIITRLDPELPAQLGELDLPPPVLYCRGELTAAPAVAIVGSRDADAYGLEVAERFATDLASRGVVVVSGLARGVDTAAHRGALAAGGKTVAILGCGIDVDYPRGHRKLSDRIARNGALVSEFRMGTHPEAWRFPVRNRIIAALAIGTLVVRATERSGSLITARLSLELGRDVYALPGNIYDRRSVGPNSLIRDGALAVQQASDIIEALPSRQQDRLVPVDGNVSGSGERGLPGTRTERAVLDVVPRGELIPQDEVVAMTGLPIEEVLAHLLSLELGGWVRRYPGPSYCRRP
ncbi:MAG: DNA-processing protein DprA [Acidobacteriota bacterium]|nr:DNA-processing protein DprA [Acidobacteriota bacterium]